MLCGSLPEPCSSQATSPSLYLSMMTGSEGVSFRLPQLFRSQHRLEEDEEGGRKAVKERKISQCVCLCTHTHRHTHFQGKRDC